MTIPASNSSLLRVPDLLWWPPVPSAVVGVGSSRITADGSIRSPLEPRCAGQPLVPSLARGVGSIRIASVSVTQPVGVERPGLRTVWIAPERASAPVGVGSVRS